MKNFKFSYFLIFSFFLFYSCDVVQNVTNSGNGTPVKANKNYVYLNDLLNGEELDRAKSTSAAKFFDFIMSNEVVKKGLRKDYEVVLETSTDVYYGIVKPSSEGSKLIVEPLFKAPIDDIKIYFPGFFDIDGKNVKSKVFYYFYDRHIESKLKPNCEHSYNFSYKKFDITLTNLGLRVDAIMDGKCYEDLQWTREVSTIMSPMNLDIIEEYIVTKDFTTGEMTEEGKINKTTDVLKKSINNPLVK